MTKTKTLFDLKDGDTFRWKDDVYMMISLDDPGPTAKVKCIMRCDVMVPLAQAPLENFNPYCEVEPGRLMTTFVPA